MERRQSKNKVDFIKQLKDAIVAEEVAGRFYRYIAQHIKNGRLRKVFLEFSDEDASIHKELLLIRLKKLTTESYIPDVNTIEPTIEISRYSVIGALNMAKESERRAIEFYTLAKQMDRPYKKIYDVIIQDEKKHWNIIEKEKKVQNMKEMHSATKDARFITLLMNIWR